MRDGEIGVLVDFFDANALLTQLIRVLTDPPLRARLGGAASYLRTVCLPQQLRWVDTLASLPPKPCDE